MNFSSIRWRLPLTYAGVALLTTLALGALMLLVLSGYYTRQERAYLQDSAEMARQAVEQALQGSMSTSDLQEQVRVQAFLNQIQIRVLNADGSVLVDSGLPNVNQMVTFSTISQGGVFLSMGGQPVEDGLVVNMNGTEPIGTADDAPAQIVTGLANLPPYAITSTQVLTINQMLTNSQLDTNPGITTIVNAAPTGYSLSTAGGQPVGRSREVVSVALLSRPGSLEVSNGPAYGTEIVRSVALAWLYAGLAAVILAIFSGVWVSRQVSSPVLALTEAARRMQYGDLSSRASLEDRNAAQEFAILAGTFNQMARRVEDTISTLQAFVSDAAHELNTPLTALRTNLELASTEVDPERRALFLGRAVEQNLRLERLAGGLLDLSRLETGQAAAGFEPIEMETLITAIAESFASRAEQAERNFTLDLPGWPMFVTGSRLQIQRLVENLLENALKFTPSGGTIALRLYQQAGSAVLTLTDNGIGITPEDLPHVFERFHRGRNSAGYPGTGLGLAIVKAIAGLHGGQVEAQSPSASGAGSQFTLRLPLQLH